MSNSRQAGSLDLLSGPWSGIWHQGAHNQGKESLDLVFNESQVIGFGSDCDGDFQYSGTFTPAGAVTLGKVYTRPLIIVPPRITYLGLWNGRRIVGTWTDDTSRSNSGPFRMWPGSGPDPGEVLETEAEPGLKAELVTVGPSRHHSERNRHD